MAYIRSSGGGIPSSLKTDMNDVLNKKLSTSTTYAPSVWAETVNLLGKLPERTASGSIAHFDDGADDVPLKTARFYFNPVQAAGTPTPSSPISIYGHTGLDITKTGANIFGGETFKDGIVASMPSAIVDTVNKTVTFASNATVNQRITDGYISGKFKANTQYTFILALEKTSGTGSNLRIYYTDGTYTAIPNISTTDTKEIKTVVSTSGKTVNFLSKANQAGSTVAYYDECGIFEGSLTESDFEAYTGTIYPVSWTSKGTVYGGYYNSKTGELWKTYEGVAFDTLTWTSSGSGTSARWYCADLTSAIKKPQYASEILDMKMEKYQPINYGVTLSNYPDYISVLSDGRLITYKYDDNSPSGLCVYPLATPVLVGIIDPTVINSYLGVNNIYHDANGDTDVTYRADIDLLITELGG